MGKFGLNRVLIKKKERGNLASDNCGLGNYYYWLPNKKDGIS